MRVGGCVLSRMLMMRDPCCSMLRIDGTREDFTMNPTPPCSAFIPPCVLVHSEGSEAKNVVYSVAGPPSLACPLSFVSVSATMSSRLDVAQALMASRLVSSLMP